MSDKGYEFKQVKVRLKLEDATPLYSNEMITSPDRAIEIMAEAMKNLPVEHVCVVNLDSKNSPINFNIVSIGSITQAQFTISDLFRSSILSNSVSIMVLHNHPSGGLEPSDEDWKVTARMIEAGKLLGVPVTDHIIVGGIHGHTYSLREEKPYLFSVSEKTPVYNVDAARVPLKERVKELTDKLEQGISDLYNSDSYKSYLEAMSKFHSYSLNNSLLISIANPNATYVASYQTWKKLGRQVSKGEHGIPILVPTPYKKKIKQPKLDANGKEIMDQDGKPVMETSEKLIQHYKIGYVFDISQTDPNGKPLPELVHQLHGDVSGYKELFQAIKDTSSVPIGFEQIKDGSNGYYHNLDKRIAIKQGLSQEQTVKTAIHECAHSILHDKETGSDKTADRFIKEQTAESVAYCVCNHYGIDTSDYSFGYILSWAKDKDPKEFKSRLQVIRDTSHDLISKIDTRLQELLQEKERERYLTYYAAECSEFHNLGRVFESRTLDETCMKYKEMLDVDNGMIPSIGFKYHDKNDNIYNDTEMDLISGRIIDAESINQISVYRNNEEVQQAIQELKQAFPDARIRGGSEVFIEDLEQRVQEKSLFRHR